ncbi:MAG: hypothetical protein GY859_06275, partial [Desulfobacterales bacterium]|nr:hypothetical protein [Desulfobacterales bacterium]
MFKNLSSIMKLVFWILSGVLVLAIGIYYFPREMEGLDFWGSLYYTIRLFILEHDLSTFPRARPLVFAYFFAPLLTLSAAGSIISYIFHASPVLRTKWKKDHVIICGFGRTGKIMATALKKKGVKVVGVDWGHRDQFQQFHSDSGIPIILGDFMSIKVLKKAGCDGARALIFASGDDLTNLEGVVGAYGHMPCEDGPTRILWAHIANEKLAATARTALRTSGSVGIRIFDTYQIATSRMIAKHFQGEERRRIKSISILGFGKFGRDLLESLVRDAGPDEQWTIRVVDVRDREKDVMALASDLHMKCRVSFTRADIKMMEIEKTDSTAHFICTDDDIRNLAMALMLCDRMNG